MNDFVSFWTIYFGIGIVMISRRNYTDKTRPFMMDFAIGLCALLCWPLVMVNKTNI